MQRTRAEGEEEVGHRDCLRLGAIVEAEAEAGRRLRRLVRLDDRPHSVGLLSAGH